MKALSGDSPLVVFTAAATAGAGILVARPVLSLLGLATPTGGIGESCWGAGLLAGGLVVSLAHLGRPERLGQALRGLPRSPVSNEVALASLCIAAALARALLGEDGSAAAVTLHVFSGLVAAVFLLSLGLVYRLGGQPGWRGAPRLSPLILGLAFGAVFLQGTDRLGREAVTACLVALGLDAALAVARTWNTLRIDGPLAPVHPRLFVLGPSLLALRLGLVNGVPVVLLSLGLAPAALAVLAAGVLMDRVAFYGLAAQQTTESELQGVEAAISAARSRDTVQS